MSRIHKNTSGFTIVELLMAMAVFSFVLIIIVVAFTQLMKSYRQGVTSQKTQALTREILTEMTRLAHESNDITVSSSSGSVRVCIGNRQYDHNSAQGSLMLGRKTNDACQSVAADRTDLIGEDFRVLNFEVNPRASVNNRVLGANVRLTVATNTLDLLELGTQTCNPALSGSQFCSVSTINTSVGLRGE